ncbi:hypothetical protein ES703_82402 [subsurface metagenome]
MLVFIGPVEEHFLSVVRNSIVFSRSIKPLRNKVAFIIIPAEKIEQVIKDICLLFLRRLYSFNPFLLIKVSLDQRGVPVGRFDISIRENCVRWKIFLYLLLKLFQIFTIVGLVLFSENTTFLINLFWQLLCEKVLDLMPLNIEKPVDAEIKICHIQLEKLPKELLQLHKVFRYHHISFLSPASYKAILFRPPRRRENWLI